MTNGNSLYGSYLHQIKLKQLLGIAVLPLSVALLVCTIPLELAFAQNSQNASQNASGTNVKGSSSSSSSASSNPAKNQSQSQSQSTSKNPNPNQSANKALVNVTPGSAATITTTGNKTIVTTTPTPSQAGGNNLALNKTGFTNLSILRVNGKTFPVKYDIKGGNLVGILGDKDRATLVLVLNPGTKGGNLTIELPRNMIDSKGASNVDTKYQIKIDGKGVDYKEVANNAYARVLSIDFSKDNRFMEIIGTKIVS